MTINNSNVFSTTKCNTVFTNLDKKLHVGSCILTFSSDDYLVHTSISLISFVVNLAKEVCLGRYCRIRDHCIVRHSLRYYRHSDPVIYISKLPAPSISMPCDYRILQSPTKERSIT